MDAAHGTSTTLWNWSDHNGEPGIKKPSRTNIEEEPCPEDLVPLHQLCNRCRRFFDNWTEMHACFEGPPIVETNLDIKSEILKLCTVAELMESRDACHSCEMLFEQ